MYNISILTSKNYLPLEEDCACAEKILTIRKNQLTDEDCACAMTASFVQAKWGNHTLCATSPLHHSKLTKSQTAIFNPLGPTNTIVLNRQAMRVLETFEQPHTLEEAQLIISGIGLAHVTDVIKKMIAFGLLTQINQQATIIRSQPDIITSWLQLTDRCNLQCDYCYLPHTCEDLSPETGHAAVDATFRSAVENGFRKVKLKYAGGEPLLRFPLILEMQRYAQSLAERHNLDLDGVVLSNGTLLTTEMIEMMKSYDLRLMISLDGLGQYHDCHRNYAGGRGSSADVVKAIELALAHDLTPNISITVSGRNVEGLPEVIDWVVERDSPFCINFYRENDLSTIHSDLKLEEKKIITGMLAAFKVVEDNLPRRSLLSALTDRANFGAPHQRTCGVEHNFLVFDSHGHLSKCQMQMDHPVSIDEGEDALTALQKDKSGIQNISVEEKEGCRDCQWRYWCAGGCPLQTFRATGRYDLKSPLCSIYQAIFPEVLRLEGLRLLKYQDNPEIVQKIVL